MPIDRDAGMCDAVMANSRPETGGRGGLYLAPSLLFFIPLQHTSQKHFKKEEFALTLSSKCQSTMAERQGSGGMKRSGTMRPQSG